MSQDWSEKARAFAADPDGLAILRGVGAGDELAERAFADRCEEMGVTFADAGQRKLFLFVCSLWLADAAKDEGGR